MVGCVLRPPSPPCIPTPTDTTCPSFCMELLLLQQATTIAHAPANSFCMEMLMLEAEDQQATSITHAPANSISIKILLLEAEGQQATSITHAPADSIFHLHVPYTQAIYLPLSSLTNMAVFNRKRLHPDSFFFGQQQFDIPFHQLRVAAGSKQITASQAAQTGLFSDVGCMNPHTYRPNEFFANDMVYEGLVSYQDGKIVPALAEKWVSRHSWAFITRAV